MELWTSERVRELAAAGETLTVEFKGESRERFSDQALVEAVVCLANGQGGTLLIGVEDDGRITGARHRHEARTDVSRVEALLGNRTRPAAAARAQVVRVEELEVLVIAVPKAQSPVATADGKYLRRAWGGDGKPSCQPFFIYEMPQAGMAFGAHDPSLTPLPSARFEDLDPLELERYRSLIRHHGPRGDASLLDLDGRELIQALGGLEGDGSQGGLRLLALLLFGREHALRRLVPTHEVAWQVLRGTHVDENVFFRAPLLKVFTELGERFRQRNRSIEDVDLFSTQIPDYSEEGFREALANALVHRDYRAPGAAHVQWSEDSIRIDSPGGFPEGVGLHNLLVTAPRPRNPMLADAFHRAGVVERSGRGVDRIFAGQLRYGRPVPDYSLTTAQTVTVRLHGGAANLVFARFVAAQGRQGRELSVWELVLLSELVRERELTTKRAAELVQQDEGKAREWLNRMVEGGIVEARGDGRGRTYLLSAASYGALGQKAAYVRKRGFEPIQQEQMVLQYVQRHGSITRREAAELCRISDAQAKYLLVKVSEIHREFVLSGRGRGAHYEWRPDG